MAKPSLPEGYIAASPTAEVYAVDSATLAKNGEVHLTGRGNGVALDAFVEFSIKDDPRLLALREQAKAIGKTYGDKTSPSYIADDIQREKKISGELIEKIYEAYGEYKEGGGRNPEETRTNASGIKDVAYFAFTGKLRDQDTAKLENMGKDELVCRHQAAIMSVLLNEAGVPNHMVFSVVPTSALTKGAPNETAGVSQKPASAATEGDIGWHAYVVTEKGGLVEATVAGSKFSKEFVYTPIVNGVTAEDIVYFGQAAITQDKEVYGGHGGDGKCTPQNVLRAWQSAVERHKDTLLEPAPSPIVKATPQTPGPSQATPQTSGPSQATTRYNPLSDPHSRYFSPEQNYSGIFTFTEEPKNNGPATSYYEAVTSWIKTTVEKVVPYIPEKKMSDPGTTSPDTPKDRLDRAEKKTPGTKVELPEGLNEDVLRAVKQAGLTLNKMDVAKANLDGMGTHVGGRSTGPKQIG